MTTGDDHPTSADDQTPLGESGLGHAHESTPPPASQPATPPAEPPAGPTSSPPAEPPTSLPYGFAPPADWAGPRSEAEPPAWAMPQAGAGQSEATQRLDATQPVEVLAGPEPKPRSWAMMGTAAGVALAVLVGGVVYAVGQLSGGGTQPEELVPSSAFAFAKLDLDPAAGQKLAFRSFAQHFPDAAEALGGNADLRELIFSSIAEDAGLDYEADVEPWLGDRFAVAAMPGTIGNEPDVAVYIQVTDQDRAETVLPEMIGGEESPAALAFRRGYAIVSPDQDTLDRVQALAAEGTLGSEDTFQADMADLGEDEVAAAWLDLEGLLAAAMTAGEGGLLGLPADQQEALDAFQGRIAITARFSDDYAEIFGRTVGFDATQGLDSAAKPVGPLMRDLPPDTGAALAVSGLGTNVESGWSDMSDALGTAAGEAGEVEAMLADLEARYDLTLPDDLVTLLGEQTLLAMDLRALESGLPLFGARSVTDAAAAEDVVGKVLSMLEFDFGVDVSALPIHWTAAGDSLYVTGDPSYTDALQHGGGVTDPAFETALPDLDSAQLALWVDVDGLSAADPASSPGDSAAEVMNHIAGVGITAGYEDSGNATFRLRVVAD